jgi:hypothetical protein
MLIRWISPALLKKVLSFSWLVWNAKFPTQMPCFPFFCLAWSAASEGAGAPLSSGRVFSLLAFFRKAAWERTGSSVSEGTGEKERRRFEVSFFREISGSESEPLDEPEEEGVGDGEDMGEPGTCDEKTKKIEEMKKRSKRFQDLNDRLNRLKRIDLGPPCPRTSGPNAHRKSWRTLGSQRALQLQQKTGKKRWKRRKKTSKYRDRPVLSALLLQ